MENQDIGFAFAYKESAKELASFALAVPLLG